jgi:septation ring formation regulator EzrA
MSVSSNASFIFAFIFFYRKKVNGQLLSLHEWAEHTKSMLVNDHLPFLSVALMKLLGSSSPKSSFRNVNTNPVS